MDADSPMLSFTFRKKLNIGNNRSSSITLRVCYCFPIFNKQRQVYQRYDNRETGG